MFAGKTTELINRVASVELASQRCLVLKYSRDVRYSQSAVATHNMRLHEAVPCHCFRPNLPKALKCDLIAIDEAQFFPDLIEFCGALAMRRKRVVVVGLDGTFQRRPFGRVPDLIPLCTSVEKLTAVCQETGEAAAFSHRKTSATKVELIGRNDIYSAASRTVMVGCQTVGDISLILGPRGAGKTAKLGKEVGDGPVYVKMLPTLGEISDCRHVGVDDAEDVEGVCEWADMMATADKRADAPGDIGARPEARASDAASPSLPVCPVGRGRDPDGWRRVRVKWHPIHRSCDRICLELIVRRWPAAGEVTGRTIRPEVRKSRIVGTEFRASIFLTETRPPMPPMGDGRGRAS
jgi:thymidine kinase